MTKPGCVVDALQELMKISLNQIYISHTSHRDSFPLDRQIYDVKAPFRMEYEQPIIIKFLFNDGINPRQIVEKLEVQLHEDAYSFRAVQFWIGEVQ
jgi:putative cell wall-binding protein